MGGRGKFPADVPTSSETVSVGIMALDISVLELLCSRVFHDLASPIGAIRNGLELIEDMDDEDGGPPDTSFMGEAIKLVDHSSLQAKRRLQLFRFAYGSAGRRVRGLGDLRTAAAEWVEGTRTRVDWPAGAVPESVSERTGLAKVLLNAVMLAQDSLTHGGVITVAGQGDETSGRATVTAQGRPGDLTPEMREALDGETEPEDLNEKTVHAFVTGRFAETYKVRLAAAPAGPETLVITLEW